MRVGISVECAACGRTKAPRGRSVPHEIANYLCSHYDCEHFYEEPFPGDLWPGETEEEFGYPISGHATKEQGA